jgi:hypothetical protein
MATFVATTASNGPRLLDPEAARRVVERYHWDGDVTESIEHHQADAQSYLALYGYDWLGAWKIPDGVTPEEFEPDYDVDPYDGFEAFLRDIATCLAEPLTVQAVGAEKCRFPLAACEWHIKPGGSEIQLTCFQHSAGDPDLVPEASADIPLLASEASSPPE